MSATSAVIASIFCIVWSVLLWEAWKTPITSDNFEEDDFDIEKQWVKFGIQNKYVDKNDKKSIKDWIKLLKNKNKNKNKNEKY